MINKVVRLNFFWILMALTPVFIGLIVFFRYNPLIEFQILSLASLCYLMSAILHHLKDKTLKLEVMVEYILIAGLVLIVLQSLLF